jgi:hypothetical protein
MVSTLMASLLETAYDGSWIERPNWHSFGDNPLAMQA